MKKNNILTYFLLLVSSFIIFFPLIYALLASFMPTIDIVTGKIIPSSIDLKNYRELIKIFPMGKFFTNSLLTSIAGMVSQVIICSMTAYALVFVDFKNKKLVFLVVMLSMFIPWEAIFVPNYITILKAGLTNIIQNSKFEVGTAFIPNESGKFNGSVIGGASLWITDSEDSAKEDAAWNFVKYAVSKDVQAFWSSNTGYFPVNKESYDTALMKETMEKMPQFKVVVDELKATNKNTATQGAILGVFPDVREKMVETMEAVSEGKDGQKAADDVIKASNRIISRYNRINK